MFIGFHFLFRPPNESGGVLWSMLFCEWAIIGGFVCGLATKQSTFWTAFICALLPAIAIYCGFNFQSVANRPASVSPRQNLVESSNTPKDGFDKALEEMSK